MFEIEKEYLDSHEVRLDVAFEDNAVQQTMRSVAREVSREVNIPGFRKGRAPYSKIVRYVGENVLLQEAAEDLLENNYEEILKAADVEPYGPGEFEDMSTDPLTFTLRVPLQPTVELGDYSGIRREWEEPDVSEEEMEQVLEQVREEHAVLEPVDRPAEMGDEVYGNILGTVGGDVIVDEEEIEMTLSETTPFLSREFVAELVGASPGETVEFSAVLPETIEDPSLQGVECDFEVEVIQVYNRDLPDVDDALASTVGSFETVEELRQDIHDRIVESKLNQARESYRNAIVEELVEMSEVEYPPIALEETLDDLVEETERQVRRNQQMALEDALRLQGQTMEMFRQNLEPEAERRLKRSFVLSEFANQEGIEITEDEVVQEYSRMMMSIGMEGDDLDRLSLNSEMARSLRNGILGRKTLERLEAIAKGEGEREAVESGEDEETEAETETEPETEGDAGTEGGADTEGDAETTPVVEESEGEAASDEAASVEDEMTEEDETDA